MDIKEAQELLNNTIGSIKEHGFYIDNKNKVKEDKEVYVLSVNGTFYDEYMGDSDWRYRTVSGDIVIIDRAALKLINNIYDVNEDDAGTHADDISVASATLRSILEEEDDDFYRLYSVESAEFYNVGKSDNSVSFIDECDDQWYFEITVCKKLLSSIETFEVSAELFGCI